MKENLAFTPLSIDVFIYRLIVHVHVVAMLHVYSKEGGELFLKKRSWNEKKKKKISKQSIKAL